MLGEWSLCVNFLVFCFLLVFVLLICCWFKMAGSSVSLMQQTVDRLICYLHLLQLRLL